MIDAIRKIGEYVAGKNVDRETFLKNICLEIEPERGIIQKDGTKKKLKQHIVFINFVINDKEEEQTNDDNKEYEYTLFNQFDKGKCRIEIYFEEINAGGKNSGKKYLYVGNASANSQKIYATSNKFSNVIKSIIVTEKKEILDNFFKKKEYKNGKNVKTLYYINSSFFSYSDFKKISKLNNKIEKEEDEKKLNKYTSNLLDITEKEIQRSLNLNENNVALYTILVNNKSITNNQEYEKNIFYEKIGKLFVDKGKYKKNHRDKSICSVCGRDDIKTTSNVTNLKFKFYMNDKLGFASNLDGKFKNNYNICQDCYQYLMIAERYINEKLISRIGGLYAYVLPKLFHDIDNFNIDDFSEFITSKNQQISDIRKAEDFLEEELEIFDKHNNEYIIDYLFFQSSGSSSEFKIYKLIKDIPPSRINFIKKREQDIRKLIDEKFRGDNNFYIDFNRIWGCIPIKIQKGNKHGYSKYLDILDGIFSNRKIKYDFLINQTLATLRIIKFETPKYNIWNREDIINKIIQLNFLILFIKKLNILGGLKMDKQRKEHITDGMIPKDILGYWENLEIYQDNQKKGLFLLGYLIGEIGKQQEVKEIKNKPILNKLNFQGMGKEKLIRLSNDVLEKLKQYKLLDFNENIYSASHLMIEENLENWSLTNQENVFYILSGFAFSYYLLRNRTKDKFSEELQEKIKLIEKMKTKGQNVERFEEILQKARKTGTEEHKYTDARKILKEIKN